MTRTLGLAMRLVSGHHILFIMKYVRIEEESTGNIRYGSLQPDGTLLALIGDIFNEPSMGDEVIRGRLLAPVVPSSLLCMGLNYRKHAEETGLYLPTYPMVFMKSPSSLLDPGQAIQLPRHLRSDKVDYEAELAVVIGRRCKNVSRENALDCVLGYTCANDISARDWQKEKGGGQFCRAKSFDTFCPLGPCLVTPDEITDPGVLGIRGILNETVMQNSNTSDMVFDVPSLIAFLSGSSTLMPGTVILTGTPAGVGMAQKPYRWLKPGDTFGVEIDGIGILSNPVVEEK